MIEIQKLEQYLPCFIKRQYGVSFPSHLLRGPFHNLHFLTSRMGPIFSPPRNVSAQGAVGSTHSSR